MSIELARYFTKHKLKIVEPADVMTLELLDFWRLHELQYPIVFVIVCDLLIPPISIVASKSAFSI